MLSVIKTMQVKLTYSEYDWLRNIFRIFLKIPEILRIFLKDQESFGTF